MGPKGSRGPVFDARARVCQDKVRIGESFERDSNSIEEKSL